MEGQRHSVTSADGTRIGLLKALATEVSVPVLLILGSASPAWAHDIIGELAAVLPRSTLAVLDGQGHEATDSAPDLLASRLAGFFSY